MSNKELKVGDVIQGKAPYHRKIATVKAIEDGVIHVVTIPFRTGKGAKPIETIWEGEYNIVTPENESC